MISPCNNLKKEACGVCSKQINVGHRAVVCNNCNEICHKKCSKSKNYVLFREKSYCNMCIMKCEIIRYNPFYSLLQNDHSDKFFEDEPPEYIENLQEMSDILETCRSYTIKEFCNMKQSMEDKNCNSEKLEFSSYFENIDGNQTNFDKFAAKISSIIGLAETNIDKIDKNLYKLGGDYSSEYSSKIEGKSKGSGLALYVKNNYNFSVIEELTSCNDNIESLFIKITNTAVPIIAGVIYRSPNGDLNAFNKEFELLLSKLPQNNCYIMGDYNVDLHKLSTKAEHEFEEIIISNGFLPLISLSTHHQVNCKKSCIDNIITNQSPKNITISGKFLSPAQSHSGIFQISANIGCNERKAPEKIKIEYEYSKDNIQSFVELLENKLNQPIKSYDNFEEYLKKFQFGIKEESSLESKFEDFISIFQSCIDETCKLEKPKITKRNQINNCH